MLGVVLLEAELQRRVEHRGAMRAPQVRTGTGLPHHLAAAAPSGVARPPSSALKGIE